MTDLPANAAGLLVLRVAVGAVMMAHGWNHIFGGGRIEGTARWFETLGMTPGRLHAWTASITELGAGLMLVLGLLTPLAAAGVVGLMVVAWATNHRKNGFFIFRPGEGWEYVMTLSAAGVALCLLGPGDASLDRALGLTDLPASLHWAAAALGPSAAAFLLAVCWRPTSAVRD